MLLTIKSTVLYVKKNIMENKEKYCTITIT